MNKDEEEIIEKLAPSLSKFGKVRDGVYQFRCIYCGDSRKNPNKRRGYLYLKGNSYNYCCHNCNHRGSLKELLKDFKTGTFYWIIFFQFSLRGLKSIPLA